MKRFRFPYQALLEHRRRTERDRQIAVAGIERERREVERSLAECQAAINSAQSDLRAALLPASPNGEGAAASLNVSAVRLQANAALHLRLRGNQLVLKLAGIHRRLEAARAELASAAKDRRAVELLKERRFEEWKASLRKTEDAETDEIAVIRAATTGRETAAPAGGAP